MKDQNKNLKLAMKQFQAGLVKTDKDNPFSKQMAAPLFLPFWWHHYAY